MVAHFLKVSGMRMLDEVSVSVCVSASVCASVSSCVTAAHLHELSQAFRRTSAFAALS